jgi:transposase InsO family protein
MKVSKKYMTNKQLQVYGARIRYAWFRKAEELGNVKEACKYYGIPRSSYYYWHSRWLESGKKLPSLYDQPKVAKTHPNELLGTRKGLILAIRKTTGFGKDNLSYVLARDYSIKISPTGIGNVLRRENLVKKTKRRKRTRKLNDYIYYPGEKLQLDVKHWHRVAYQYDIIDCATRIKYKRLYDNFTPENTVNFLKRAERFFNPAFQFVAVQTDNGSENTYTQFPNIKIKHPVDIYLESRGIKHILIKASSPHLNGFIERSHGVDKRGFRLTGKDMTYKNLNEFLTKDCEKYNTYRPHQSLEMKTPLEYLRSLPGFEHANIDLTMLSV